MTDFARLLDADFAFVSRWFLSERGDTCYKPHDRSIELNPNQVWAWMARASIPKRYTDFCFFYVMAHEKAHAYQDRRFRDSGRNWAHAYNANPVPFELQADFIAGALHRYEEWGAYAWNILRKRRYKGIRGVRQRLFSFCDPDLTAGAISAALASGLGNPATHGTGRMRERAFLSGRDAMDQCLILDAALRPLEQRYGFPEALADLYEESIRRYP